MLREFIKSLLERPDEDFDREEEFQNFLSFEFNIIKLSNKHRKLDAFDHPPFQFVMNEFLDGTGYVTRKHRFQHRIKCAHPVCREHEYCQHPNVSRA